jgi:hypothetical protein
MKIIFCLILFVTPDEGTNLVNLIEPVFSALALILSGAAFIFTVFFQLKRGGEYQADTKHCVE